MKKTLHVIIAGLLIGLILKGSGIIDAIILFIIIGALPGTSLSLSPSLTMVIITTLVVTAIVSLVTRLEQPNSDHASGAKKPIRRYSKI